MRFTTAAVASGLAAFAVAESNGTWSETGKPWGPPSASDVWVTEVVTAFTTYCPEATAITHGGSTYSVTSATTLTITNCPGGCTITKPVSSSVPTTPASVMATTPAMSKPSVGTSAPYKPSNGTAISTAKPTGTGAKTTSASASSTVAPYKGDASKASFGVAGLLAAVGLIAAL